MNDRLDLRAEPRFQWGQKVVACFDLVNDGGHPEYPPDALLVAAGTVGEIVQVGAHTQTQTPIYLVEFEGGTVVGCLEEEIERVSVILAEAGLDPGA
jgi:nitrogen fixation protein NifZ